MLEIYADICKNFTINFECPHCGYQFQYSDNVDFEEFNKIYDSVKDNREQAIIECPECNAKFIITEFEERNY